MSVDDIMKSITAGLTGDAQKDIQFLRDQIAFRSRQENGREIEQECNRLIFSMLPTETKDRFTDLMNRDAKTWHGIISEADLNMSHHNVDQVIQILEPVVSDLYQLELFFIWMILKPSIIISQSSSKSFFTANCLTVSWISSRSRSPSVLCTAGIAARFLKKTAVVMLPNVSRKRFAGTRSIQISCSNTQSAIRHQEIWTGSIRSHWVCVKWPSVRNLSPAVTGI